MPSAAAVSSATPAVYSASKLRSALKKSYDAMTIVTPIKAPQPGVPATKNISESMYTAYVQNMLDQLLVHHNPELLNALVAELELPASSKDALSEQQLLYLIRALTAEASRLDNPASQVMISCLLKIRWANKDPQFVATYVRFLGVLVSSIPKWWTDVANNLVSQFIHENTAPHHNVLTYILHIIPTSAPSLPHIFAQNFPHKSDSASHFTAYIRNLLRTVEYSPELQKSVWALILERIVQLDVELYEEMDDSDDEEEDEDDDDTDDDDDENDLAGKPAPHDDDDSDSDGEGDYGEYSDDGEYEADVDMREELAATKAKLDSVMCMLFIHLDAKFNVETVSSPETVKLFKTMLELFQTYILPTHRTRSVQYLVFRMCHAHAHLLDAFLMSLIELALSPTENIERRQKAMQYISSFIARSNGLSRDQIVSVVRFLSGWLERYINEREVEVDNSMGGMGRFRMFYSVSQALFYIFCFRHSLLRRENASETSEWECDLDRLFQRLIVTKFNPLRYCKRTVVAMFARIAQKENVAYCFTIMEQNRLGGFRAQSSSRPSSNNGSPLSGPSNSSYFGTGPNFWNKGQEFVTLEAYFPFDPLVLKKARKTLVGLYVEWEDVADGIDSGSEEENDDDEDVDENDADSSDDSDEDLMDEDSD